MGNADKTQATLSIKHKGRPIDGTYPITPRKAKQPHFKGICRISESGYQFKFMPSSILPSLDDVPPDLWQVFDEDTSYGHQF
jgi:hypothetical protein